MYKIHHYSWHWWNCGLPSKRKVNVRMWLVGVVIHPKYRTCKFRYAAQSLMFRSTVARVAQIPIIYGEGVSGRVTELQRVLLGDDESVQETWRNVKRSASPAGEPERQESVLAGKKCAVAVRSPEAFLSQWSVLCCFSESQSCSAVLVT